MSESLCDFVADNPGCAPSGWRMVNDRSLVDPTDCTFLDDTSGLSGPPGSYSIYEQDDNGHSVLVASLWTGDPQLAIYMAVAASAHQYVEMNPGQQIRISIEADPPE